LPERVGCLMNDLALIFLILFLIAVALVVLLFVRLASARRSIELALAGRAEANVVQVGLRDNLRRAACQFDALGDATPDALLLLNENRQITWGNQAAWSMFNEGGPALGQTFIGLVRDYELNQGVADALSGNRAIMRQAAIGPRSLRVCASPVEVFGGVAVIIEDVTELQRLGRARRDFVANISHELRTPLANIDLAAQTLQQAGASDPQLARRMLDQIQAQVQTLSQLSQEMMELAQIESGQVLLKLEPMPLEPVVRRSVAHLIPQAAAKHQHLSLAVPGDLMVLIDEQHIGRVIGNLVHNAVKFTPENGIVTVQAEMAGEDVQICVSDTGPGIPKDEQSRVFERFYKADRARSKGGTGLGLAIARHIVEGHGGRIWVTSEPGQGATFCFTVPRA
jgi:two-component system, OmpR family, phosphate regulon sensor histidine kinase PhoR